MNDETHIDALPHAAGIEKATLSVFLQYPESWHEKGDLSAIWYYLPANRLLFEAIDETVAVGNALELVSFVQLLADTGRLSAIGGPGYVTEVYGYQPSPSHLQSHIGKLRSKLACRMVIETADRMREVALQAPEDSELIDCTGLPITAILDTLTGSKRSLTMKELGLEFMARYQRKLNREETSYGIRTGIDEIDDAIKGLHPKMMTIISAKPSGGKSTLGTQIFCGIGQQGIKVGYFPLEGTPSAAYERSLIQLARLHHKIIKDPIEWSELNGRNTITGKEAKAIQNATLEMDKGNLIIDPPANQRLDTVLATIRRSVRKHGIKVAFIDFVQLISANGYRNKEEEVSYISKAIYRQQVELNYHTVLMSQENENGDTKHAKAIEEDGDSWIQIVQNQDRNHEDFKKHLFMRVAKDRHNGNSGKRLPLILNHDLVRFEYGIPELPEKGRKPANF